MCYGFVIQTYGISFDIRFVYRFVGILVVIWILIRLLRGSHQDGPR